MRRRAGSILGTLTAVMAAAACDAGQPCNRLLPACSLSIKLEHGAWEPGVYTFSSTADGVAGVCTVALPFEPEAVPDCMGLSFSPFPDSPAPLGGEWPESVHLFGEPVQIELTVEREGVVLASEGFRPRYTESEPNGDGCGICRNASETLVF